jgi:hypothetical protein
MVKPVSLPIRFPIWHHKKTNIDNQPINSNFVITWMPACLHRQYMHNPASNRALPHTGFKPGFKPHHHQPQAGTRKMHSDIQDNACMHACTHG